MNATTDTVQDGLKLGQWLSNQRSKARTYQHRHGTPSSRAQALSAIDPWWNPPWTLEWKRSWHQAHTHVQGGHVLEASAGFPGSSSALATWLTTQCAQYDTLHPDQQHLLADIGLTHETAHTSPINPYTETALAHARAYAATHHTLAVAYSTVHDGFPLGRWPNDQRQQARRDTTPNARHQALTAIDP